MLNQKFEVLEQTRMKLFVTINGVDNINDFEINGYCKEVTSGSCGIKKFDVVDVTENKVTLLLPAMKSGLYGYQLFIINKNTNQSFLVLEGRLEVTKSLSSDVTLSENYVETEATISSDTLEVTCNIEKGIQGDKGDKGDKGEQGYSAYEVATHHGYNGTEEEWVQAFEGAQDAAAEAKSAATAAASSEAMAEYYYKGSQTHYTNTVTEALNAEQSANNAQSAATAAEQYSNSAKSSEAAAQEQAMNAASYAGNAASYASQAQQSANSAKSSVTEAKNYSKESGQYYTQSASSAAAAAGSATAAANSATAAESSATAAASSASKLGNAALKNSNNTFSGTNTFNNVTKVTVAPNSYTSVMNEEASILLDFVQQAGIRTVDQTLTKITGSGAQSDGGTLIRYTVPKNDTVSVWKGSIYPFFVSSYFGWASVWIPVYTNISQHTNSATGCKFRFIASLTTNVQGATDTGDIGIKIIKQSSDITKPFLNFDNIKTNHHCAVVEILCEVENKKLKWTLYAPVFGSGKVEQIKVISFTTASGTYNYSNDTGFLFVYSGTNKVKIFFRDFYTGSYRWQYCGEIDMRNGMFTGSDYDRSIIYAASGVDVAFNIYLPKQITFLPYWINNGTFANCQQILQSVTSTDFTETIITIDEYNALQA